MKAKRKQLDVFSLDDLSLAVEGNLEVTNFSPPAQRQKGIMVESAEQLIAELKNRGVL